MSQKVATDKTRATRAKMASPPTANLSSLTVSSESCGIGREVDGTDRIMARLDKLDEKWETKLEKVTEKIVQNNDKMEDVEARVEQLQTTMAVSATKMATDIANLAALLDDSRKESEECRKDLNTTKRNLQIITRTLDFALTANKRLENRLNDLENRARIYNVKIDGKPEDEQENLKDYVSNLIQFFGLSGVSTSDITTIMRLGRKTTEQQHQQGSGSRPRQIMVVFANVPARNAFYFSRTKLKNSQQYPGIYINDDVTPVTQKLREDYRSVATLARKAGATIKVHGDGIVIDGVKFKHTDTLPERFSLSKAKTCKHEGQLFFQSAHSILSNFYPSPIVVEGIYYPTAEHLYQAEKCRAANDTDRLAQVMESPSPLDAKRATTRMMDTPEWRQSRESVMANVVKHKFAQNDKLAAMLLGTGDMMLNEATSDSYFGIGAKLHGRVMRDMAYTGMNKLGHILVNERECIRRSCEAAAVTHGQPTITDNTG